MIPVPGGVRVWLATGVTDMRRGMNTLALQVQEGLGRDPHAGDLYVFRGRKGDLLKILWHDGVGISLYAKRLERGRFQWPATSGGAVSIGAAQLGYLLEGIDWRNPVRTLSAISGDSEALPFTRSDSVARRTPRIRAAADTLKPSSSRASIRMKVPGCGGVIPISMPPSLIGGSPPG